MKKGGARTVAAIGIHACGRSVEARLIEPTGFGTWTTGARRIVDDVDGPVGFEPAAPGAQRAGAASVALEDDAADAWVASVANAVAKLTFGLRLPNGVDASSTSPAKLPVGLAVRGHLDRAGESVRELSYGPRVERVTHRLWQALRGRSINAAARVISAAEAWAYGEISSSLGSLTALARLQEPTSALVVHWDDEATIVLVDTFGGRAVVRDVATIEAGFLALDEIIEAADDNGDAGVGAHVPGRVLAGARRQEAESIAVIRDAASAVATAVAAVLLPGPDAANAAGRHAVPERIVLGGRLGRAALDPRLAETILGPFSTELLRALRARPAMDLVDGFAANLMQSIQSDQDESALPEGFLLVSREESAILIGAAVAAAS